MPSTSSSGPGAVRTAAGRIELNVRPPHERRRLVVVNTGDRPVQVGSHLHLPDANPALEMDRGRAHGFRLDIPAGTSQRFEPGASREVDVVTLRGARRVPGLQRGRTDGGELGPVATEGEAR
ncbi:urease subunit alpha/urease subunit beta [Isoptericola jiangsuensis]|uniref:Urease subunit alpha/urease subunit beta n=1 Tax=Isoptericola jiangsuensis TaxID=548579 RepID=A0A2A9ETA5_9MICO|nr:urease subunit beta [Isoptericola jiangsuensis]PFG42254.1 urease subunit alpha/urease subunit beta [Isoptericola jiangsuensis]